MKPERPDPGGVAGVCFALCALIIIVQQIVDIIKRL